MDGTDSSDDAAYRLPLLILAYCGGAEALKLHIKLPQDHARSAFARKMRQEVLPGIASAYRSRTVQISLHLCFAQVAVSTSIEAATLITTICQAVGPQYISAICLERPPVDSAGIAATPLRVICPRLRKFSIHPHQVQHLLDFGSWLRFGACKIVVFDVFTRESKEALSAYDSSIVLTPLLGICETLQISGYPKQAKMARNAANLKLRHLHYPPANGHLHDPNWRHLRTLAGDSLLTLRIDVEHDKLLAELVHHLSSGGLPELRRLNIGQSGNFSEANFLGNYEQLVPMCKNRSCLLLCELGLDVREGDDEPLEELLSLLSDNIEKLHLTFWYPVATDFAFTFTCLRSLFLRSDYASDDGIDIRSWHFDHSMARVVSEIRAPALRDLYLTIYVIDARYFGMLQCLLDDDGYDNRELRKFPDLARCTVRHQPDFCSPRMARFLADLVDRVRECGEVDFDIRSTR